MSSTSSSALAAQDASTRLDRRARPRVLAHAERRGDRLGHERRVGERGAARRARRRRGYVAEQRRAAVSSARRVLPIPPGPDERHQARRRRAARRTSAISRSRPTKRVTACGRFVSAGAPRGQRSSASRTRGVRLAGRHVDRRERTPVRRGAGRRAPRRTPRRSGAGRPGSFASALRIARRATGRARARARPAGAARSLHAGRGAPTTAAPRTAARR